MPNVTKITVRSANADELDWINDRYDEVGFIHSNLNDELVAIAEVNGERAGLGRLGKVGQGQAELGGMYVFPNFRQKGVAAQIVEFLLENSDQYQTIYCLPFEHLHDFYASFGFHAVENPIEVPDQVTQKHRWCNQTYSQETLLFVLKR